MHRRIALKIASARLAFAVLACSLVMPTGCATRRMVAHPSRLAYPPLRFSPPEAERVRLDCGAVVYLLTDHTLPLFSLHALARAGSAYDPAGKEGLASITATVMRTGGTRTLSADELDRELESMAAQISASTDHDASSLSLSCLSADAEKALGLYLDILLNPAFADDKIDLRRGQVREMIRRWNDEPGQIVSREFRRLVYGDYPYGHPVIGEPGSMDALSRTDLVSFHRRHFHPSGMILGAAGDFDRDAIIKRLNEAFGTEKAPPPPPLPPVTLKDTRSLNYIRKDTEQAHIIVGQLGIRRDNPDYFPLMIMNEILGSNSFTSRIMESIRVSKGLAYYAVTRLTSNIQPGLFYAVSHTKEESATEVLSLTLREMQRIRSETVAESELVRAKEALTNSFVFRFTTTSQIVNQMVSIEFFGLPRDYLKRYLEYVDAVSREDVLRAAGRYIHPDRMTIVVLGDREEFDEPLDKFGKVNVYLEIQQ